MVHLSAEKQLNYLAGKQKQRYRDGEHDHQGDTEHFGEGQLETFGLSRVISA